MEENKSKIKFQVETQRILEILSNEIYDSPYALLRENIQNAYDAILMRRSLESNHTGRIDITLSNDKIVIIDDGIGMDESTLRENFWKAGSSGKRDNELAEKAGVIGTFGIGAMANFGVCKKLEVRTKHIQSDVAYFTMAERDSLTLSEDCIDLSAISDAQINVGTTIIAYIDDNSSISFDEAKNYLKQYIEYIPVEIIINGQLCSTKNYNEDYLETKESSIFYENDNLPVNDLGFEYFLDIKLTKTNIVKARISKLSFQENTILGEILLVQGKGRLLGLRNYFGMAPIPVNQIYNFGGIVNLSILQPTAGREALSRESIAFVNNLMKSIEKQISEKLFSASIIDNNPSFLNFIQRYNRYDLAGNIKITKRPDEYSIQLKDIEELSKEKPLRYYGGTDTSLIQLHANENTNLLILSQTNPRRKIQLNFLKQKGIELLDDKVEIVKKFTFIELERSESSICIKMTSILSEDYFLDNCTIEFAEISHDLPLFINYDDEVVHIYLSRDSTAMNHLKQTYLNAYEVFTNFVKDFIRNYIYPKITEYVPSSTRQGADALQKVLSKNKELYKYEYNEQGEIESLLSDYLKGDILFSDVLKRSKTISKSHTLKFNKSQIGTIETELPDIVKDENIELNGQVKDNPETIQIALPPILRLDTESEKKLITTNQQRIELNMFKMFLGVSEQLYKMEKDFFLEPHTTKVIWGGHKVVYIFGHISNKINLYYDIELKGKLKDETIGGGAIKTTTIVTGNRIFIPVPSHLESSFYIEKGKKEFYIKYDLIYET